MKMQDTYKPAQHGHRNTYCKQSWLTTGMVPCLLCSSMLTGAETDDKDSILLARLLDLVHTVIYS